MQSILEIIRPIRLLYGSHSDTATTGQGCAMNVIAYLNGEQVITDQSPCVCSTVRELIIWLNDYLIDGDERQELLPYLLRAMGSATEDKAVIEERLHHLVIFANGAAENGRVAAAAAADDKDMSDSKRWWATKYAINLAIAKLDTGDVLIINSVIKILTSVTVIAATVDCGCNKIKTHTKIKDAAFAFLDAALPKAAPETPIIFARAQALVTLLQPH